ncbi:LysR substrate-binding domain-containing protein [Brevundimonas sp.]|uniref:LysR substrate-binding domain-containing protein n=1 Tax=Brevundimonas sp. TaxID=1871086 RepID=UPI002899ED34|nr:LysR substrate-binding domain-containing protein [Brevundimonas sp.]
MLDLGDLNVFVTVVETESFTKAGRRLGLPKSTVSRRVVRLEQHLGAQLLNRSTRSVKVTENGGLFFDYCLRSLGLLRDGERALQSLQKDPQGVVRIVTPSILSQSMLGSILADFLMAYPDVRMINTVSDDGAIALRDAYDLAIAIGPLADSGLVATKLGETECGMFAAPAYVERMGAPQGHVELPRFDLLALGVSERRQKWSLRRGRDEVTIDFNPRFISTDLNLLRQAVLSGLGIASLPAFLCKHDLAEGRLVEIMPGWHTPSLVFSAVFTDPKAVPARVRTLIDFLVERMRPRLSWDIQENVAI